MMGTRLGSCIAVLVFSACQQAAHSSHRSHDEASPASCKPEAPIAVDVATTANSGDLEVTARVVPTKAVDTVDIRLVLPPHAIALDPVAMRFGATPAGEARTLVTHVRVDGRASSITAVGRVPIAGIDMSRTATVAIGAPPPAIVSRTYTLPDGDRAREVQP
jgi:hypothetical protein